MSTIKDMYPRRFLDPADLENGKITPVEILGVDLRAVTVRAQQPGQRPGAMRSVAPRQQSQQPEPEWDLWFREFEKPMRLKRWQAEAIAQVLRTDETDEWKGRTIGIYPGQRETYGEMKPAIWIDFILPTTRPALTAPKAGGTDRATADLKAMGQANAEKLKGALAEQGATFDEALRWLKLNDAVAWELASGRELHDIPRGAAPALQRFLKAYGTEPKPSTELAQRPDSAGGGGGGPATDPIDFATGSKPAAGSPSALVVDDDEIPF